MPTTNPVPSYDPTDLLFNAQKLDEVVNGTANSFTDRLGVARRTLAGLSEEFPNAAANAAAAAASADDAAEAAQIAQDEAVVAIANSSAAQTARTGAEAARDAAMLSAGVYATTAAGLAATTSGRYFSVPSSDSAEYLILYLNNAGVAVEQNRYASTAGVETYRGTVGGLGYNNFNQMVQRGWYYNVSTACANTPYGTAAAVGAIHVEIIGPNQARQTYYKDGLLVEAWSRTFVPSTSTFSAWKRGVGLGSLSAKAIDSTSFYRGSTETTTTDPTWGLNINNFNLLNQEGFYTNPTRACTNTPYGTAAAVGTITVRNVGSDLAIQTYYKDGLLSEVWSRSFVPSTSTFSAWARQTSLTELIPAARTADNFPFREEITARIIVTDRDFNKALLPGFYTSNGSAAINNTHIGSGAVVGTLVVSKRKTDHVQVFYINDNPDDYAIRTFTDTPTFTAWSRRKNRNAGKTWCSLGDSITSGIGAGADGSYAPIASRYLGITLTNKGYGGASMAYRAGQTTVINDNCFARITAGAAMTGFDLITVAYGTNDHGNAVPLGVLGSTNENEFYGAMAVGYANIMAANPAARVVFIVPTYKQPDGTCQTYRDAIISFCQSKNLSYIESNKQLGWNSDNQATFLGDTLHPNAVGYEAYGRYIAGRLSSIW